MKEIKKAENYSSPIYPFKEDVINNPTLLKNIPKKWSYKTVAIVVSVLILSSLCSCDQTPDNFKKGLFNKNDKSRYEGVPVMPSVSPEPETSGLFLYPEIIKFVSAYKLNPANAVHSIENAINFCSENEMIAEIDKSTLHEQVLDFIKWLSAEYMI